MKGEDKLDALLARHLREDEHADVDGASTRVLKALARPLPSQRRSWRHWPAALLDWDFAPSWPRMAALASCAVVGFAVGAVGPSPLGRDAKQLSVRGDVQLVAVLSEPEAMTGVLP